MEEPQPITGGSPKTPRLGTLGTFSGVFTPSILTILGIILFLRLGYVVGEAGLGRALLILALANGISVLTSLSLSAIATNLHVRRGGDYYLISRTLGPEFGGAIGLVLFLAQAISIGFYCIGFAEVLAGLLPPPWGAHPHWFSATAAAMLFVLAWLGADWATRFQYVVMATLVAALVSFFVGGVAHWSDAQLVANWQAPLPEAGFWMLFALFFPAVTGFTQGVSMSGDLEDPGRSLPMGTLAAVGLSILVYLAVAVVFAAALPQSELTGDYEAMNKVAAFPTLIVAGVFAATLSSAMASFMGAPRILQSLAADRLFPWLRPFATGHGPQQNPRRGVLLSGVIALLTIGLGQLDLIAPVVSMFFLISYGLINYATWFEASSQSPSFRPRFRFYHRYASLAGALACLGAMLAIDLTSGLVAGILLFAIYEYLKRTAPLARWADGRRSFHIQRVREHLLAIADEPQHPRDWRPNILLLSEDRARRAELLRFAAWLEGDSGFVTAVTILEGEGAIALKRRDEARAILQEDIRATGVQAFALVMNAPDVNLGIHTLLQGFGLGNLRANTILLNWLERVAVTDLEYRELIYGRGLRVAFRLGCNLVVLDGEESEWQRLKGAAAGDRRIDVWWRGDASSRLMLLLAHLITRDPEWEDARIRLLGICCSDDLTQTLDGLRATLDEVRISAEPVLIENTDDAAVVENSHNASLVFLPFQLKGNHPLGPFGNPLDELLEPLPVSILVLAAQDFDLDADPEEGDAAQMARAQDTLEDAERLAELTANDVRTLEEMLRARREALADDEVDTPTDPDEAEAKALRVLERQLEQARRRAARMAAKLESARREAEALGIAVETDPGDPD